MLKKMISPRAVLAMSNFTPYSALIGGALIGLAAVLLLAFNGRIAGVSGIAGGLVTHGAGPRAWRALFLLGLIVGAGACVALGVNHAAPRTGFPVWALVIAGLLTGYGTSMAGGCTSGHGVCGLSRLSPRSLVATILFMAAGFATATLLHVFL